jgi:hypothetical protein
LLGNKNRLKTFPNVFVLMENGKININYGREIFINRSEKCWKLLPAFARVRFVLISIMNLYLCFDIAPESAFRRGKMSTHAEMICHHITLLSLSSSARISIKFDCELEKLYL